MPARLHGAFFHQPDDVALRVAEHCELGRAVDGQRSQLLRFRDGFLDGAAQPKGGDGVGLIPFDDVGEAAISD